MKHHAAIASRRSQLAALILLAAVWTAPCAAQQSAAAATGTIAGRVVDSFKGPVPSAIVTLDTLGLAATADSTGAFRIEHVPAGRRTLTVRRLGFAPASVVVSVAPGASAEQTIMMATTAAALPAVKSQAVGEFGKPERLAYTMKYDEFYRRRSQSVGSGLFYTHEDLEAMKTADLPDMLRRVRYLRVQEGPGGTQLSFPGCGTNHILIKLDNQRIWPPDSLMRGSSGTVPAPDRYLGVYGATAPQLGAGAGDPFEMIGSMHLQNVEAIEVYKNVASLPVDAIGEICGAIYIWTR